ncbi:UDP-GalNAc:beta-1 [Tropilaelaps mercedesae]|uniref:UDP-GalNAc:beta-1 n=1 Tax=Tropilaelaps mercedesae TaxID=418985 RepID=A0A1V9XL89_9ACAR|nr:UDP-GalNAc:beta-1 [Tropilaelaps mercedesae]
MPEPERRLTLFLTVIFALVGFLIKGFMYYHALREAEKGSSMPIVVVAILSDSWPSITDVLTESEIRFELLSVLVFDFDIQLR